MSRLGAAINRRLYVQEMGISILSSHPSSAGFQARRFQNFFSHRIYFIPRVSKTIIKVKRAEGIKRKQFKYFASVPDVSKLWACRDVKVTFPKRGPRGLARGGGGTVEVTFAS